jgi:SAM-dependent methyltransferase
VNNKRRNQFSCPLCCYLAHDVVLQALNRDFYRCDQCRAIFVPKHQHLDPSAEKKIYDMHNNDPLDPRYRNFLAQLTNPLCAVLRPNSNGLDYGCGPGPTLSLILKEKGHQVENYDPFYYPEKAILTKQYDFITMTEVAEHLSTPREVFQKLINMLKPDGLLAIMTKFIPNNLEFKNWGYKNDPTHIIFYQAETFKWLENYLHCQIIFLDQDLVIFRK